MQKSRFTMGRTPGSLFYALLMLLLTLGPVFGQTGTATLTGSLYDAPLGSNPATVTLTGTNFAGRPAVSLALLSPDTNPGQALYPIDPVDVAVTSNTTLVVTLPTSFFSNFRTFRLNGITELRPGSYYLQVTNPGAGPSNFQVVNVPLQEVRPPSQLGWQMVSSPYTLNEAFAQMGVFAAAWQPQLNGGQGQYVVSYTTPPGQPADTFHLGQGYWIFTTTPASVFGPATGTAPTGPFSIQLQAGWNQVGDPFASSIPLSQISLQNSSGTTSFAAALSSSLVSPLYAYNANTQAYATLSSPTQTMDPWVGEWIYSFAPATLVITPPVANQYSISGLVVSADTGLPLPAQVLGLPGGPQAFINGKIQASGLSNGFYTLTIASPGYTGQIVALRVQDGDVTLPRIRLDLAAGTATRGAGARQSNAPAIDSVSFTASNPATVVLTGTNFPSNPTVVVASAPDPSHIILGLPNSFITKASSTSITITIPNAASGLPDFSSLVGSQTPPSTIYIAIQNPATQQFSVNFFPFNIPGGGATTGSTGGTTNTGTTTGGGTAGGPQVSAAYTPPSGSSAGFVTLSGSNFDGSFSVLELAPGQTGATVVPPNDPSLNFQIVNGGPTYTITIPANAPTGQYKFGVVNTTTNTASNVATVTITGGSGGTTGTTTGSTGTASVTGTTGSTSANPIGTITAAAYTPGSPDATPPSPAVITLIGNNLGTIAGGIPSGPDSATLYKVNSNGAPTFVETLYSGQFTPTDASLTTLNVYLGRPLDPGNYTITLTNPDGSTSSNSPTFNVPPVVSQFITPPPQDALNDQTAELANDLGQLVPMLTSATYDGALTITLSGTNLQGGETVTITQPNLPPITLTLDPSLVLALPSQLTFAGTYTVQVQAPGSGSRSAQSSIPSNSAAFEVGGSTPEADFVDYSPSQGSGILATQPVVQVTGNNFYQDTNGDLTVTIGGARFSGSSVTFSKDYPNILNVTLSSPLGVGNYNCTVTDPDGQVSNTISLSVTQAPVNITKVFYSRVQNPSIKAADTAGGFLYSPSSDGSTLVIKGTGFQPKARVRVDWDDNLIYVGSISGDGTLIAASNPTYLTTDPGSNPHYVVITNPDGGETTYALTVNPSSGTPNTKAALNNGLALFGAANNGVGDSFQVFNTNLGASALPVVMLSNSGGNIVAAGGGNVISNDGGSLVAGGGGNIVAAGGGNLISQDGSGLIPLPQNVLSGIIAAGGGNIVAAGGGNIVAAGGGNIIAAGGGNLIAQNINAIVAGGGGNVVSTNASNLLNLTGAGGLLGPGNSFFSGVSNLIANSGGG